MRKLLAAALILTGCGESTPPDIGTTRLEIEALVKKFHEHMGQGNHDALLEMLTPEFSLAWSGEEPVHGKEKAGQTLKEFIDILKSKDLIGKRKPRFSEIRVHQEGTLAWAVYSVAFLEMQPPFEETYTQLFKRTSGKWLLIHDHRSPRK
jgi:ketosteroid isomerase-like protein